MECWIGQRPMGRSTYVVGVPEEADTKALLTRSWIMIGQLKQLAELRDQGILTDEEFNAQRLGYSHEQGHAAASVAHRFDQITAGREGAGRSRKGPSGTGATSSRPTSPSGAWSAPTVPTPPALDGNHLCRASRSGYQRPETSNMTHRACARYARLPLPRGLIVVLGVTGILVSVLALRQFAEIIGPVLLALVLVVGVHPLTGFLRRRGAPMWLAATTTLLALVLVIFGLAASLALSVAQLATLIPTYQDSFTALVNNLRAWLGSFGVGPDQLQAALSQINFANVAAVVADLLGGYGRRVLQPAVPAVRGGVHGHRRRPGSRGGWPGRSGSARRSSARWTGSRPAPALPAGLDGVRGDRGGHRRRLPLAGRGPVAAAVGAARVHHQLHPQRRIHHRDDAARAAGPARGRTGLMLTVIVAYSVINFIIQSVIQPKILADAVNLSLTLTFLSLVFWAFVIGPIGALLAVPLTLLMKALLLDADPNTRWISSLLEGGPPPLEDAADDVATTRAGPKPASDEVASQGAASEDASPPGIALAGDG